MQSCASPTRQANTSESEDLLRSELLHFKQVCAAHEKRIQELESERALVARPPLVIPNSIVSNKSAVYIDSRMVAELRHLGFSEDQARETFSQSNNNLSDVADIVMTPLDTTNTRVRFDDTRLRVPVMTPRGRGRGGSTHTQPLRPGLMYDRQSMPPVVSQSVHTHRDQLRDQLPPVLDKLVDSLSGLKGTMSTLGAGSATRDHSV